MEKIKYPLYHGTSTLFKDSIDTYGLGQVDIAKKYDLIKVLSRLMMFAKAEIPYWKKHSVYIEAMINGHKLNPHWRYGQTFLTPSFHTAMQCAKNQYGSELVTIIVKMYKDLMTHGHQFRVGNDFFQEILYKKYEPVLLRYDDIPSELLEPETPGKLASQIDLINHSLMDDDLLAPISFRLKGPLISSNYSEIH